jgi:hypothetical protein
LTSIDGIRRHRVSKQFSLGASARLSTNAIIAFLARCVEWDDHLVAHGEVADCITFLDDSSDKLMPANEIWRALKVATVEVQIGTLQFIGDQWENMEEGDSSSDAQSGELTHRAVDVTLSIASVGFCSFGYGRSSTATWN